MKKKFYEHPEAEVILFRLENNILSGTGGGDDWNEHDEE